MSNVCSKPGGKDFPTNPKSEEAKCSLPKDSQGAIFSTRGTEGSQPDMDSSEPKPPVRAPQGLHCQKHTGASYQGEIQDETETTLLRQYRWEEKTEEDQANVMKSTKEGTLYPSHRKCFLHDPHHPGNAGTCISLKMQHH